MATPMEHDEEPMVVPVVQNVPSVPTILPIPVGLGPVAVHSKAFSRTAPVILSPLRSMPPPTVSASAATPRASFPLPMVTPTAPPVFNSNIPKVVSTPTVVTTPVPGPSTSEVASPLVPSVPAVSAIELLPPVDASYSIARAPFPTSGEIYLAYQEFVQAFLVAGVDATSSPAGALRVARDWVL